MQASRGVCLAAPLRWTYAQQLRRPSTVVRTQGLQTTCVCFVHMVQSSYRAHKTTCALWPPHAASTCTAGHTIMVSGLTLAFGLLGLLLFKVEFLQALGVGCCIAVVRALITRDARNDSCARLEFGLFSPLSRHTVCHTPCASCLPSLLP